MKKVFFSKLIMLMVVIFCVCCQNIHAQRRNNNQNSQNNNQNNNNQDNNSNQNNNNNNNQNNQGKSGDEFPTLRRLRPHNEVKAQPEKSKEKSNDPNYDSNGILRFSASFMRWWNENITPGSGTPENPSYPNNSNAGHGPYFPNAANGFNSYALTANAKNYYLSYGIGIGISMKGGKFKYEDGSATENLLYIQIPLMARFNYVLNNGGTAFIGAGPYYGIAISGNYEDDTGKTKLKFGNSLEDGDDYRRGDIGLKIGLGYKLQSQPIFLGLTTDIGLRNISVGGDKEVKIKNQSIGLMIGYVFE